jgi:GT2 family glycosyltransferase
LTDFGEVTVIVPHWNRADLLDEVLKRLSQQTYPIHQTVVVDNGSTDHSERVARVFGAAWIEMGSNRGFAPAVNRGIAASATEWVAILNNDVMPERTWLEKLVGAASAANAYFACGKLLSAHSPATLDGGFDALSRAGTAWRCGQARPDGGIWSEPRTIQFAPLTAALFRRDIFDRLGPLDERFESYLEDVDLGIRCAMAGFTGVYAPSAIARHIGSATLGAWHKSTVRRLARNQTFLVMKHFRGAPLYPVLVGQLLWGVIAFRHGRGFAWIAGKWDALRRRKELRGPANNWERIRTQVEKSERDILELQRQTGFDRYWRWYFSLTGGASL